MNNFTTTIADFHSKVEKLTRSVLFHVMHHVAQFLLTDQDKALFVTSCDLLARDLGCFPVFWPLLRRGGPRLALRVLLGPLTPAHYRLAGRDAWRGENCFQNRLPTSLVYRCFNICLYVLPNEIFIGDIPD